MTDELVAIATYFHCRTMNKSSGITVFFFCHRCVASRELLDTYNYRLGTIVSWPSAVPPACRNY